MYDSLDYFYKSQEAKVCENRNKVTQNSGVQTFVMSRQKTEENKSVVFVLSKLLHTARV